MRHEEERKPRPEIVHLQACINSRLHVGDGVGEGDNLAYRAKEEEEEMRQRHDPLTNFEERTVSAELVSSEDLRKIDGDVMALLDEAVAFAEASPLPRPEDVLSDVYVRY